MPHLTSLVPYLLIGLAVVGLVARLFSRRIKGWAGERRVRRSLDSGGFPHLHDIYVPSRDGVTQIDHVALVGGAVVVLETKNFSGAIYGDARGGQWTQVLAEGRIKNSFRSPLRQNYGHVKSVEAALPSGTAVRGLVVFAGGATFPKGMPEGVVRVRDLRKALARLARDTPASAGSEQAWRALSGMVGTTDRKAAKAEHRRTLAARSRP